MQKNIAVINQVTGGSDAMLVHHSVAACSVKKIVEIGGTSADFSEFVTAEIGNWGKVARPASSRLIKIECMRFCAGIQRRQGDCHPVFRNSSLFDGRLMH
ncbi:MAG: hypothetical protein RJA24_260 [Pseudomonadota bacterium]